MKLTEYAERVENRGRDLAETLADPEIDKEDQLYKETVKEYRNALTDLYDEAGREPDIDEMVDLDIREIEATMDSLINHSFAVGGSTVVKIPTGGLET